MATRSMIAQVQDDDTIIAAYCHYDGYPKGVGRTLLTHYNHSENKIEELICLQSFSSLHDSVQKTAMEQHKDVNTAASPDECRHYSWTELKERPDIKYTYIRVGGKRGEWKVYQHRNGTFLSIADAIWRQE